MQALKSLTDFFGLKRNLVVLLIAIFVIGAGEELWMRFVPKYLQAVGATVFVIGLYDALRTLLGAIYAYPGGVLADRWGHRHAFIIFNVVSIVGYALVLLIPNWGGVIAGMFFFLSWSCFSLPATFSLVGAALEANRHSMGVGVQSVIRRLPMMISPIIGGILIDQFGIIGGVRIALIVSIFLSAMTILVQRQLRETHRTTERKTWRRPLCTWSDGRFWQSVRGFNPPMRRLLLSDILVRFCERVPYAWVVIFAMDYIGVREHKLAFSRQSRCSQPRCASFPPHISPTISARTIRYRDLHHVHAFSNQLVDVAQFFRPGHCVHDPGPKGIRRYVP